MARNRSKKTGKWKISAHEFYMAMHFAYQYHEWKKELTGLTDTSKAIQYSDMPKGSLNPDPTGDLVERREHLVRNIDIVESCARKADPELYEWLMLGVTNDGINYESLRTLKCIPCSRNTYYERRRKFYYLLSKQI
ncbi:MAG: hypothetical protein IIX65_09370 [Lachnospiraceae bacterium]|jgi:hypothetical protein|nr:hypothetical protein [Lachnospiraceae bacterium]